MSTLERVVRETRDQLDAMEGLIGSVLGREPEGRRRLAVIATDRRVLIVGLRGAPPLALAYPDIEEVSVLEGADGLALRLRTVDACHDVTRIDDREALRLLVELVQARSGERRAVRPAPTPRVRIIV